MPVANSLRLLLISAVRENASRSRSGSARDRLLLFHRPGWGMNAGSHIIMFKNGHGPIPLVHVQRIHDPGKVCVIQFMMQWQTKDPPADILRNRHVGSGHVREMMQ